MKKHIIYFFLKLKYFLKGYEHRFVFDDYDGHDEFVRDSYLNCEGYTFSDKIKKHKKYDFCECEDIICYRDNKMLFKLENIIKRKLYDVKDKIIAMESSSPYKIHIVDIKDGSEVIRKCFIKSKLHIVFSKSTSTPRFIYEDFKTRKYTMMDYEGNVLATNIDDYKKCEGQFLDTLVYKINNSYYLATGTCVKSYVFDYIFDHEPNSDVLIGVVNNPDENTKYFKLITCADDLDESPNYKSIKRLSSPSDEHEFFEVITENGAKRIVDELGFDVYNVDFVTTDYYQEGAAIVNIAGRGRGIVKLDGTIIYGDIKKKVFGFRKVEYGGFKEIFAGVENFDGYIYIDLKGKYHPIYDMKKFKEYEEEEEKNNED